MALEISLGVHRCARENGTLHFTLSLQLPLRQDKKYFIIIAEHILYQSTRRMSTNCGVPHTFWQALNFYGL
jgi:hypothetical protein